MIYLIFLLVFITVTLLVYCIYKMIFEKRIIIRNRLETTSYILDSYNEFVDLDKNTSLFNFTYLIKLIGKISPLKKYLSGKKKKLNKASTLMKPEEYFGIMLISGLIGGVMLFLLLNSIIMLLLGYILGFLLPDVILNRIINKRSKKLNGQIPEALNIISNGIRAGYSFHQALTVAAKEVPQPISDEFKKVLKENQFGKPIEEALLNMSDRTQDEDIDMFVTALIIQRQVGGNLSETLDTISNTIRDRVKVKGEIKTLTSQGKLSAIVISILPIALACIIFMMNPGYINTLLSNSLGITILCFAAIMEFMGIIILRKLVNIEI